MKSRVIGAAIALASVSGSALAGPVVQPVQVGEETIRYDHAVPTLDEQKPHGTVQVTPLPMDHGGLAFGIAVYNGGDVPANFDIVNVDAHAGDQALPVLSAGQLDAKVRHRAMWASIALAAVGGLSAAAASSQRDHYRSTLVTPHGVYHASFSAPSVAGQVQAAAIAAGTGAGLVAIQNQLDRTRAAIGQSTVQLTTVDPHDSYAGRVVLTKVKASALPQRVDLVVHWNGDDYPFAFQIAKNGTAAPVFRALTPPPAAPGAPIPTPAVVPAAPAPAGPVTTAAAIPVQPVALASGGGAR